MSNDTTGVGRTLIFGADRGGVGKTFLTAATAVAISQIGGHFQVAEYEVSARIGSIVGRIAGCDGVKHRPASIDVSAMQANPLLAQEFWDTFFVDDLVEGNLLVDTAANSISQMLKVADNMCAGEHLNGGANLGFVVPLTADSFSHGAAIEVAERASKAFPAARIWFVRNLRDGDFAMMKAFEALMRSYGDDSVINVPALQSTMAPRLLKLPLDMLLATKAQEIEKLFEVNWAVAGREAKKLAVFVDETLRALMPLAHWYMGAGGAPSEQVFRGNEEG